MESLVTYKDIFSGIYKNKKVLVTGHTGFKGSWLSLWLLNLGANVAGFSLYLPSEPCNFEILGLKERMTHCQGDVRNIEELTKVFDDFRPEIVFHLAAQPIVRKAYDEPKITFDTNLGGTVNVLECIRNNPQVLSAVIITSDKCYENYNLERGYHEEDRLGGYDPYSASKACAEIAASAFSRSYFNKEDSVKIATTRAGNVIGGGDWAKDRIVPDCIRAWSEGKEVVLRNPEATRPWQHVLEPLSGYLWLGAKLISEPCDLASQAFNFGPNNGVIESVGSVVSKLAKMWPKATWRHIAENGRKEANLLQLSCDKARTYLGWRSALNFTETISFTGNWYRNYCQGEDSYAFSCLQIEEYIQKARAKEIVWSNME